MHIDESKKLLLSDTMIPDIFILEYLPTLSGLAVKAYLLLVMTARTRRSLSEQDLARRLGHDSDTVRSALIELASKELIKLSEKEIEVADIKAAEIERIYRPKTTSMPQEAIASQEKFSQREKLMADIARTFFQGLMSPSWYGEIDAWFDRYGFDPEVIYALFQECARRNKLDSKAYISRVAENWSKRGIISFNDLNRYFLEHDRVSQMSRKVGKKLKKKMTEYDDEMVARWVQQLGYDFDIIDLALRKTTKLNHPNLSFADRILQEWFEHQLSDADSIKAYEQKKAERLTRERQNKRNQDSKSSANRNRGNFSQRTYSDEFLNGFYEDLAEEEDQPPGSTSINSKKALPLTELMEWTEENDRKEQAKTTDQGEERPRDQQEVRQP
jgi:DnaD/phage-associated family protein